jgi:hypothetical protein
MKLVNRVATMDVVHVHIQILNSILAVLPSLLCLCSIPSSQQLMYFFAFVTGGGVFLLLAFMLFLPVIILSPSKFALSFTIGCMLIMAGFGQLRGWSNYVQHMLSQERLPFSAGMCEQN